MNEKDETKPAALSGVSAPVGVEPFATNERWQEWLDHAIARWPEAESALIATATALGPPGKITDADIEWAKSEAALTPAAAPRVGDKLREIRRRAIESGGLVPRPAAEVIAELDGQWTTPAASEASPAEQVGEDGLPEELEAFAKDFLPKSPTRLMCERAANLIRRLASGQVPEGWQPIETAPKDGTLILLAIPQGVVAASWQEWAPGEWWFGSDIVDYDDATHWMPLPAAPSPEKQG